MAGPRSRETPPSGEQHEIRHGPQRAVITQVGATLRIYSVDGVDVVDGFARDEPSPGGRGQVLAPWPNRLDEGRFEFRGREAQAALDEPSRRNAIHGLVRWLPWEPVSRSAGRITLACVLHPQPGYPWRLELRVEYRLSRQGLTVTTTARNRSWQVAPFGLGFHPYLTVGTSLVDEAVLSIAADRRLVTDRRGLPTAEAPVAGSEFDFTSPRRIGEARLDAAYADLARGRDGRARVDLEDPVGRRGLTLWVAAGFGYLMVYTGDGVELPARRRRGIAIEPMTCPPNAFRTGIDVISLDPGDAWRSSWGITPRPAPSSRSERTRRPPR